MVGYAFCFERIGNAAQRLWVGKAWQLSWLNLFGIARDVEVSVEVEVSERRIFGLTATRALPCEWRFRSSLALG
jgi:hypothetical protein